MRNKIKSYDARKNRRTKILTRKATLGDVKEIHILINKFAKRKLLLPRSLSYIYDNIRDFFVCENREKRIVGCCALHIVWEGLAEIKSLAVKRSYQGRHIGTILAKRCLNEAGELNVDRVFALTYNPEFFRKLKFSRTNKSLLPAKVWRECIDCPLFPNCEEIAVIKKL